MPGQTLFGPLRVAMKIASFNINNINKRQDIAGRRDDGGDTFRGRGIAGRRHEPRAGERLADHRDRLLDIGRLAAIDGDLGTVLRQRLRDRAANPLGGTGDQGAKPGKIDFHAKSRD